MRRMIPRNPRPVSRFERPYDMDPLVYEVLLSRGIETAEEAQRFLHPSLDDLRDPYLLSDMRAAVDCIRDHLNRRSPITIYGDYDVDGITSSSILYTHLRSLDADVDVYLPDRHTEGYGLNEAAIRRIAQRSRLLVTVDCGITNGPLIDLAKQLGMDCVVTDHHRPPETLPDCPTVNPLLNDYPFPSLCGAGVAFQLVRALSGDEAALPLIDLAALGTIADLVPLIDENRVITTYGLARINRHERLGIRALISAAGLSGKPVLASHVAFQLAPRLNASGRVGSARDAFELLTTHDESRAEALALFLNAENDNRKQIEQKILSDARKQLEAYDFVHNHAILLWGEGWNEGVIGLAASRLLEQYHMPTLMFARNGDTLVGSCRSIDGVDIHAVLTACADLLTRFGGHRLAAGLTLPFENLPQLIDRINRTIEQNCDPACYTPVSVYDCQPDLRLLSLETLHALDCFQPTGMGNPAPLFLAEGEMCSWRTIGSDNQHLKFELAADGRHDAVGFSLVPELQRPVGGTYRMIFSPKENTYRGRTTIQLDVRALIQSSDCQRESETNRNLPAIHAHFLTELFYNRDISVPLPDQRPSVSRDQLIRTLTNTAQGTLVICGDSTLAFELIRACGSIHELYINAFPQQPISHNAICLLPCGELPEHCHYDRVILAGLPPGLYPFPNAELLAVEPAFWLRQLPDLDALRQIYSAARRLLAPGTLPQDRLIQGISAATRLSGEAVRAGLAVYRELQLIDASEGVRPSLSMAPFRKVSPESSKCYRLIEALRRWSGHFPER